MIYSSPTVNAVAFLAICGAVLLAPIYAIWLAGGMVADRAERRRGSQVLKGMRETPYFNWMKK